jgi:hypothetical protein
LFNSPPVRGLIPWNRECRSACWLTAFDPEVARAMIDPALKVMIEAALRYDGFVVQSTGDGIFALFGAPAAYEDHPQRALYTALRLQEELRRYSAKVVAGGGIPIAARGRREHRRSGGAQRRDRPARRVHADRAYDQPGVAAAERGAGRLDCGERSHASVVRGLLHAQATRRNQGQGH